MSENIIDKNDKELKRFIAVCQKEIAETIAFLEEQKEERRFLITEIKAGLYDTKRI